MAIYHGMQSVVTNDNDSDLLRVNESRGHVRVRVPTGHNSSNAVSFIPSALSPIHRLT